MSVRRINQTGRQRIAREHATFALKTEADGSLAYTMDLHLESYKLPLEARVFVEAYRQLSYERLDHGTVGGLETPATRSLKLFRDGDQVQFRVKVINTTTIEGCLLGEADKLKPEVGGTEPGHKVSLLPAEARDLGDEAWRLEIEDSPLLLVNNRLGDYRQLARTPSFVWLVYPAVLRDILRHILIAQDHRSIDDPSDWQDQWLMAAMQMGKATELPSTSAATDTVEEWITDAVAGFARKHRLLEVFGRQTFDGEDS